MNTEAESTPKKARGLGGRPPKFDEARRPVTVTLPQRILDKLSALDPDRSRAIVRCVEATLDGEATGMAGDVQLIEMTEGKALISIGPCPALRRISWLRLIETSPGRFLLALPPGTPVDSLEVAILDLVDDLSPEDKDRTTLDELRKLIGNQRRKKTVSKAEFVLVDI